VHSAARRNAQSSGVQVAKKTSGEQGDWDAEIGVDLGLRAAYWALKPRCESVGQPREREVQIGGAAACITDGEGAFGMRVVRKVLSNLIGEDHLGELTTN